MTQAAAIDRRYGRRILWFGPLRQSLHVLPMLVGAQCVMLLVRLAGDAEFPGLEYFAGALIATLLWHPISFVLLLPPSWVLVVLLESLEGHANCTRLERV